MKIKNNDYYEKLYVRLLRAYDLKRTNHNQVEWYNIYSKSHPDYKSDYKDYINVSIIMKILKTSVSSLIQKKNS